MKFLKSQFLFEDLFWARIFCLFKIIGLMFFLSSCTRPAGNRSLLKIATGGNSSLGGFPANRKICYAVNITGPGIPSSGSGNCQIPRGASAGFVAAGGGLELDVPSGA